MICLSKLILTPQAHLIHVVIIRRRPIRATMTKLDFDLRDRAGAVPVPVVRATDKPIATHEDTATKIDGISVPEDAHPEVAVNWHRFCLSGLGGIAVLEHEGRTGACPTVLYIPMCYDIIFGVEKLDSKMSHLGIRRL